MLFHTSGVHSDVALWVRVCFDLGHCGCVSRLCLCYRLRLAGTPSPHLPPCQPPAYPTPCVSTQKVHPSLCVLCYAFLCCAPLSPQHQPSTGLESYTRFCQVAVWEFCELADWEGPDFGSIAWECCSSIAAMFANPVLPQDFCGCRLFVCD